MNAMGATVIDRHGGAAQSLACERERASRPTGRLQLHRGG